MKSRAQNLPKGTGQIGQDAAERPLEPNRGTTHNAPSYKLKKEEWFDKNERVIGALCQPTNTSLIRSVEPKKRLGDS